MKKEDTEFGMFMTGLVVGIVLMGMIMTFIFADKNEKYELSNIEFRISDLEIKQAEACTHGCTADNTSNLIACADDCTKYYLNVTLDEWFENLPLRE